MVGKLVSACVIAALAAALFLSVVDSPPTTVDLDADIAKLQSQISDARKKSDSFAGGLLKALVDVRIEILSSTEAMLEAKRASILRRINLSFHIDGSEFKPATNLEDIQADISAAQKRVALAEAEAAKYSGGLLQILQLTKVATEDITVAQLNSAYYSAKYGLPTLGAFAPKGPSNDIKKAPPGEIVSDKDAL